MNANGVDVLHTADGDSVIRRVAHNLELDFLVSLNALLNENLANGRCRKRANRKLAKLRLIVSKAAARTAKGECRTKNYGVADSRRYLNSLLKRVCNVGGNNGLSNRLAKLLKELSVLCSLDTLARCTEKLNACFLKNSLLFKKHSHIKTGLTADAGDYRVRTLVSDYLCNIFKSQGLHIDLICNSGIGHYGCRVGVDENNLVSLLLERKTRLSSCIVKLRSLTDNDRARADYHNSLNISSLCHFLFPPFY